MRRFLPKTLFGRALLILVTPLVLVQLIAGYVFYDRVWETVTRRLTAALAGDIGMTIQMLARAEGAEQRRRVLDTAFWTMGIRATLDEGTRLDVGASERGSGLLERRLSRALDPERIGLRGEW